MCSKQAEPDEQTQKARIIDSAIRLFALKRSDKVTVRELTKDAQVNVGAINYYFGSKDALTETVFLELARRLNAERVVNLDKVLADARDKGKPPMLEAIVNTFLKPYLDTGSNAEAGQLLAQFILRHRLEPTAMTQRIIRKHFDPMAKRYIEALALSTPAVDPKELMWRYVFMVSTVVLTISDRSPSNRLARLSGGFADPNQRQDLKTALLRFIVGGLRA